MENSGKKSERTQLFRFCLYGFLKNQQYFEPFLILAFLEKGMSFLQIGLLVSFRAVCVNLLEIPSGAAADVWGKRRSMIASMSAYIISFALFAAADKYLMFFPAMFLFAIGETFRTGTHKAMIFDWLQHCGRETERTKIYGFTRSWSKIGSALNVIIAAGVVIYSGSYTWVFLISIIPFLLNIINFTFYPAFLDGHPDRQRNLKEVLLTLRNGVVRCFSRKVLRNMIAENICFEGYYSTAKEYLQPLLKTAAVALPVLTASSGKTRTALLVAAVYAALNLISSAASRKSHKLTKAAGGEFQIAAWIMILSLFCYLAAGTGFLLNYSAISIAAFILLALMLNVWKPVFVSRFYGFVEKESGATALSVVSQTKSLSVALIAPGIGWLVDYVSHSAPAPQLWPVAAGGVCFALIHMFFHTANRKVEGGGA